MNLPFISRASHIELVSILREEIAELKAERRQTLDYILQASAGRGLFTELTRPVPIKEVSSPGYFGKPMNEDSPEMEEAKSLRHPRTALQRLQKAVNDEADNMQSEALKLIRDTVSEGQQAAN